MPTLVKKQRKPFFQGVIDGLPIGFGYFAVAFSLGITAGKVGLDAIQGFLMSLTALTSTGEYAGLTVIAEDSGIIEMIILTLVTNARYILMSCALSQRCGEEMPLKHRMGLSMFLTDELFAITISQKGNVNPLYTYGAGAFAAPMWALGTALGIVVGNIIPQRVVMALCVAIYGMFIAAFTPAAKNDKRTAAAILVSFVLSFITSRVQPFAGMSSGTRSIILIIAISAAAAFFMPVRGEKVQEEEAC